MSNSIDQARMSYQTGRRAKVRLYKRTLVKLARRRKVAAKKAHYE